MFNFPVFSSLLLFFCFFFLFACLVVVCHISNGNSFMNFVTFRVLLAKESRSNYFKADLVSGNINKQE